VLIVGTGPREQLNCSSSARYIFLGTAAFFGEGTGGAVAGRATTRKEGGVAARTKKKKEEKAKESGGILGAIEKKANELEEAVPRPPIRREAPGEPSPIFGVLALGFLALSALAILFYIIRFLRGPHTESA
jgi:hypothetical protein